MRYLSLYLREAFANAPLKAKRRLAHMVQPGAAVYLSRVSAVVVVGDVTRGPEVEVEVEMDGARQMRQILRVGRKRERWMRSSSWHAGPGRVADKTCTGVFVVWYRI